LKAWKSINPPIKEEDLIGKWYGVVYATKKSSQLFVESAAKIPVR